MSGDLSVAGFISAKPFISLRVATSGGTPSTYNAGVFVLGTPGTVTLTNLGYNNTVVCTRGTAGNTNYFLYTFTWTGAHPLGAYNSANAIFHTSGTGSGQPANTPVITVNVSSTQITVWIRGIVSGNSNVLQDGNFYMYSVP